MLVVLIILNNTKYHVVLFTNLTLEASIRHLQNSTELQEAEGVTCECCGVGGREKEVLLVKPLFVGYQDAINTEVDCP